MVARGRYPHPGSRQEAILLLVQEEQQRQRALSTIAQILVTGNPTGDAVRAAKNLVLEAYYGRADAADKKRAQEEVERFVSTVSHIPFRPIRPEDLSEVPVGTPHVRQKK